MSNIKKIVGIGEVLWDILPSGRQLGGAPANFAYHVSQTGLEGHVVSAIGNDDLGAEILTSLTEKNLHCHIATVNFPTGTVDVKLNSDGIPTYQINQNVAWDNIPYSDELEALAKECNGVCFGTLASRCLVSRLAINKFIDSIPDRDDVYKVFDINLRQNYYDKESVKTSLTRCNVLKLNDEEALTVASLFGYDCTDKRTISTRLMNEFGIKIVVLTCGVTGSYVFTPDIESFEPTPKVNVVDTVGAGDAFTAAFIASILKGDSIKTAHKKAVDIAAYVCTQAGATPTYQLS